MTTEPRLDVDPPTRVRLMIYGHLLSRALCVFAALGVADVLSAGSRPAAALAACCAVDAAAMERLLRSLSAFDVVDELPDGTYRLTELGDALRDGARASARPTALLAGAEFGRSWNALMDAIRTGRPAFESEFGTDFFTGLAERPRLRDDFYRSQEAGLELEVGQIAAAADLDRASLLVDVGGGDGALVEHVLRPRLALHAVVLDREPAVTSARARMAAAGLSRRCRAVAGDFFTAVPGGGDVYLLRHILHDWPDDRCVRILEVCRDCMPPAARLVIVELAAPGRSGGSDASRHLAALMDLYMLTVVGGRERTLGEIEALLLDAGLAVGQVTPLAAGSTVVEARR